MRAVAGLVTLAALALTACGSSASGLGAGIDAHVHNLAVDGDRILLGTHEGLWEQRPGAEPQQVSEDAFDVMGLSLGADRWYASGHPGEGMDAPGDLGLLASDDGGRTWSEVSLGGEVDFHRLVTSGDVILGINAHDGRLLRSEDAGLTWTDLGTPPLFDLAVDPSDAAVVVATTEEGLVRSYRRRAHVRPRRDVVPAGPARMDGTDAARRRHRGPGPLIGGRGTHLDAPRDPRRPSPPPSPPRARPSQCRSTTTCSSRRTAVAPSSRASPISAGTEPQPITRPTPENRSPYQGPRKSVISTSSVGFAACTILPPPMYIPTWCAPLPK